jgi:hypothetical protein
VDLGPGQALIGPLADARRKFDKQLTKVRDGVADVDDAAGGIAQIAKGPSKYLLLAANNAEMRAGSGMFLSAGTLTFQDGKFSLAPMQSTAELQLPAGAVPVTGDLAARWGWAHPSQEWRDLAMSPDFPPNADLAMQMWKAKTGEQVDGVLVLDPVALQGLVAATGPVEVDGKAITKDNVVQEILLQQYLDAGQGDASNPENDTPEQRNRRERLSRIARAIVDRLDQTGWDAGQLVDDLRTAAEGRHVLAWSDRPEQRRAWEAAGIAGQLHANSVLPAVLNRAGNKLDQFLDVDATLESAAAKGGRDVTIRIKLRNVTPGGLTSYVEGPYPFSDFEAGEYSGILAVDVPHAAGRPRIEGQQLVAAGPDGPARVVATNVDLRRGEEKEYQVKFFLPDGYTAMRIEPSARRPQVVWHQGARRWTDDTVVTVHA